MQVLNRHQSYGGLPGFGEQRIATGDIGESRCPVGTAQKVRGYTKNLQTCETAARGISKILTELSIGSASDKVEAQEASATDMLRILSHVSVIQENLIGLREMETLVQTMAAAESSSVSTEPFQPPRGNSEMMNHPTTHYPGENALFQEQQQWRMYSRDDSLNLNCPILTRPDENSLLLPQVVRSRRNSNSSCVYAPEGCPRVRRFSASSNMGFTPPWGQPVGAPQVPPGWLVPNESCSVTNPLRTPLLPVQERRECINICTDMWLQSQADFLAVKANEELEARRLVIHLRNGSYDIAQKAMIAEKGRTEESYHMQEVLNYIRDETVEELSKFAPNGSEDSSIGFLQRAVLLDDNQRSNKKIILLQMESSIETKSTMEALTRAVRAMKRIDERSDFKYAQGYVLSCNKEVRRVKAFMKEGRRAVAELTNHTMVMYMGCALLQFDVKIASFCSLIKDKVIVKAIRFQRQLENTNTGRRILYLHELAEDEPAIPFSGEGEGIEGRLQYKWLDLHEAVELIHSKANEPDIVLV